MSGQYPEESIYSRIGTYIGTQNDKTLAASTTPKAAICPSFTQETSVTSQKVYPIAYIELGVGLNGVPIFKYAEFIESVGSSDTSTGKRIPFSSVILSGDAMNRGNSSRRGTQLISYSTGTSNWALLTGRHDNKCNVLAGDGHVETLNQQGIMDAHIFRQRSATFWRAVTVTGCYANTFGNSWAANKDIIGE